VAGNDINVAACVLHPAPDISSGAATSVAVAAQSAAMKAMAVFGVSYASSILICGVTGGNDDIIQ